MAKTIQQVIVIGGGIGGLCAAIALRQIGMDVKVYEQIAAFEPVGAGLAVWANAIRAPRKLGIADQVDHPLLCSIRELLIGILAPRVIKQFEKAMDYHI